MSWEIINLRDSLNQEKHQKDENKEAGWSDCFGLIDIDVTLAFIKDRIHGENTHKNS